MEIIEHKEASKIILAVIGRMDSLTAPAFDQYVSNCVSRWKLTLQSMSFQSRMKGVIPQHLRCRPDILGFLGMLFNCLPGRANEGTGT